MNLAHPAALPRLTGNEAQALTLIARHGADVPVQLAPTQGASADAPASAWRIGLAAGAPDALRQAATLAADIEWAGASLRLCVTPNVPAAWLAARLPDLQPGPLPEPLCAMALESLLDEVTASLSRVSSSGPARVTALNAAAARRLSHAWTVTARAEATGEAGHAVLEADGLGLMLLAGLLAQAAPVPNAVDVERLPVALRATVGMTMLPLAQLRELAPRDVVFLDEYYVGQQGELWLAAGQGQGVRVRADNATYLVTQGWTTLMTQTDTPAAEEGAAPAEALDRDAIPVRLTFDLGERSLSIGELQRLQPGATFDLQRPLADGPVMIRANGALIGTGELVEVDGRIGVTVATLGKQTA